MGIQNNGLERRSNRRFFLKGRLLDQVQLEQAQAALSVVSSQLATAYPETNEGRQVTVISSQDVRLHPKLDATLLPIALLLMAIPGLVLLVACSNLANLLLTRASGRTREVAIRQALGAGRLRLVRLMLSESVLLALVGGVGGVILAMWGVQAILALQPPLPLPIALNIPLDVRVLGFAFGIALLTGCAFASPPPLGRLDLASFPH